MTLSERLQELKLKMMKENEEKLKLTKEEQESINKLTPPIKMNENEEKLPPTKPQPPTKPNQQNNQDNTTPSYDESEDENDSYNESETQRGLPKGAMESLLEEVSEPPTLKDRLFDSNEILMKTRLTPEMVVQIANIKTMALFEEMPEFEYYADILMQGRVSLLGEGRKEGVEMEKGTALYGFASDVAQRTRG